MADPIEQLRSLPRNPVTIPTRIQLCQRALEQVGRKDQPKLWAQLHSEMGLCFMQSPTGDPADNLEQAIEHYEWAREEYTPTAYFDEWVATMHNLAVIYGRRIRGNRAQNQEKAIGLLKEILQTDTSHISPQAWALSHYDLGRLYTQRVEGDQSENLETAIYHCQQALQVWTSARNPVEWIKIQDLLGTLHRHRWCGDPAENVEDSLCYHRAALAELESRKETRSRSWARVHHNAGTALFHRIRGNRADNLEKAIAHLEKALQVRTRQAFPLEWAETQHNLAVAYLERQQGDRAKFIEQAIELLEAVLKIRQREKYPVEWAKAQNALGIAHLKRIHGERVENLERAIGHLEAALQEQERVGPAEEKASTQHNLAITYSERLLEDRLGNLEQAAQYGEAALETLDRRDSIKWATIKTDMVDILWKLANLDRQRDVRQATAIMEEAIAHGKEVVSALADQPPSHRQALAHYNLGNVYSDRIRGNRMDNQEKAIGHYSRALDFYTDQNFPDRWADTHNNLGVTYWERSLGSRGANLKQAVQHFSQALEVYTPDTAPVNARRAASNWGRLHFEERQWSQAHKAFATALEAAEALYQASATEAGKQAELAVNATLYAHDAYCLARRRRYIDAVLTLEQGKARMMSETLARDRAQLKRATSDDRTAFEQARHRLKELEAEQRAAQPTRPFTEIADELRDARAKLQDAVKRIRDRQPDFMPVAPDFSTIAAAARPGRPLVYLTTTSQGSVAIIVPVQAGKLGKEHVVWLDQFKEEDLAALLVEGDGENVTGGYLVSQLFGDAQMLEVALDRTLTVIGERLMMPLARRLHHLGISALTLIPGGRLSLLPLHAARHNGGYLIDDFAVAYAPSARTLAHSHDRLAALHVLHPTLFAIGNPMPVSNPLTFARIEAETVAPFFAADARRLFLDKEATHPQVSGTLTEGVNGGHTYVHFSCHGVFDPNEPLASGLLLAGEERLTLADLLDRLALNHTRLVVLSACQTAITDFNRLPDEAIGLPAGFLTAGVPGVVGSLWSVNDVSTALLMTHFYHCHRQEGLEPIVALRKAQKWMRHDLTLNQVVDYIDHYLSQLDQNQDRSDRTPPIDPVWYLELEGTRDELVKQHHENLKALPFASPYYWAAFTMSGV